VQTDPNFVEYINFQCNVIPVLVAYTVCVYVASACELKIFSVVLLHVYMHCRYLC